jgi:hypothetical protein
VISLSPHDISKRGKDMNDKCNFCLTVTGLVLSAVGCLQGWDMWNIIKDTWQNLNPWKFVFWVSLLVVFGNLFYQKLKEFNQIKNSTQGIEKTVSELKKQVEGTAKNAKDDVSKLSIRLGKIEKQLSR